MSEPAKVFEARETPGEWRVEWFDDDGRCELEMFSGHDAKRQATVAEAWAIRQELDRRLRALAHEQARLERLCAILDDAFAGQEIPQATFDVS